MADDDDSTERRYWPFSVLPASEQTTQHRNEIAFLERAYRERFMPYTCAGGDIGAGNRELGGLILVRGRNRWEVVLWNSEGKGPSEFVTDFPTAGETLLKWLRDG